MAKITRYSGNLKAFAENATGTKRTVFGDITQANDLDSNINTDFLAGWELIDETSDFPTIQDFNALGYTHGQLLSYLHQVGVPEWSGLQEYHEGSVANRAGVLYVCQTNAHISATAPESDSTNWLSLAASGVSYDNTTSGLSAETAQGAIDELADFAQDLAENPATTTGLTWGWLAGPVRSGNVITDVAAGTLTLTDDATNYVECSVILGMTVNQSSFTSGLIPIRTVVTSAGVQMSSVDERAWLSEDLSIGVGQTSQNVLGSRSIGVTYTNTTGKPIAIYITSAETVASQDLDLVVGGVTVLTSGSTAAAPDRAILFGIVPTGATYSVTATSATLSQWVELR